MCSPAVGPLPTLQADPEDTTLRLLYTTPESLQMERLRWAVPATAAPCCAWLGTRGSRLSPHAPPSDMPCIDWGQSICWVQH